VKAKAAQPKAIPTEGKPRGDAERLEQIVTWFRTNQRKLTIAGFAIVVVAAGVWFTLTARERREAFAQRELQAARLSAEAGNLALAANDLSRLIAAYDGTPASEEARLVLGQVRLLSDQPALAVADLQQFVAAGPRRRFRAPAYSLLGAALEQSGNFADAAQAYLQGADGPGYELLLAELLMDAGRAFVLAGDTTAAVSAFQRVLTDFEDPPRAVEARLRLAELRRFDLAQ
jgi:predicted negative regulator of RcsB-dependent stress response